MHDINANYKRKLLEASNTSNFNVQPSADEGGCEEDSDGETAVGSDGEVPAYDDEKNEHYNNEHAAKRIRLEPNRAT